MKTYLNLFLELGLTQEQIDEKIEECFNTMFFDEENRIYYPIGDHMGYLYDTGWLDARTEGMSYGMMMAVQMDRQDLFDRLWLFSKTYMYQSTGEFEGYFAWSVKPNGEKNSEGPAPDGEEYYAMALFFASNRWGDKTAPYNYSEQARDILRHCVHQHELVSGGNPMWNGQNYYIKFVPEVEFSDPSYHLPHFYELFAMWSDEADRDFWGKAAKASREYLVKACHPVTGMASEYAEYDGTPKQLFDKKQQFYSDAYRVAMNIGLDASWFGKTQSLTTVINNLQAFLKEKSNSLSYDSYLIDGTPMNETAMHPNAIIATTAAGSLASDNNYKMEWVNDFWNLPLRTGKRRYYDNCLHFLSLLMLSGKYKIYE